MTNSILRHINAIIETGSIAAASRKIYVSQPAMSQFVHRVEEDYGITVFDRSTSPWKLTQEGEYLVKCQERIEAIDRECRLFFSDRNDLKSGEIIIGSTAYRTATLLNPVLAVFKKRYPNIVVKIMEGTTEEVINLTKDGIVDCCFGISSMIPLELERTPVFQESVLIAVAPEFQSRIKTKKGRRPPKRFPYIQVKSLEGIPFIIMKRGQVFHEYFGVICERYKIQLPVALETQSILTVPALVSTGIGGALIPSTIIPECEANGLVLYELDNILPINEVSIAWKKNRHQRQVTKKFIQSTKIELSKLSFNLLKA